MVASFPLGAAAEQFQRVLRRGWELDAPQTGRNWLCPQPVLQPVFNNTSQTCEAPGLRATGRRDRLRLQATADLNFVLAITSSRGAWLSLARAERPPHLESGVCVPGRVASPRLAHLAPGRLRPGLLREEPTPQLRASSGSTGPRKPPRNCCFLLRCSARPAPRQLQEALLTMEHCGSCLPPSPPQRGPFTASDLHLGGRGPHGLLVGQHRARGPRSPCCTWNRPFLGDKRFISFPPGSSPDGGQLVCRGEKCWLFTPTEMMQKPHRALCRKSHFLLEGRPHGDGRIYGVSGSRRTQRRSIALAAFGARGGLEKGWEGRTFTLCPFGLLEDGTT